ncbi:EAL domain-containing protein [Vibrio kasasachensis]|uniref:EAL domain-containing protein n=1 Tax=Vibrio kasasachensis TaxID=2910248 RepID=UPI003D145A18
MDKLIITNTYQPIVCLDSGDIKSYEVLCRSKMGDIKFGALDTIRLTASSIQEPLLISVVKNLIEDRVYFDMNTKFNLNASWVDLSNSHLLLKVIHLFEKSSFPFGDLTIELTESSECVISDELINNFASFSSLGTKFSLDDFGCGFNSFEKFLFLPFTEVKFDKNIMERMCKFHKGSVEFKKFVSFLKSSGLCVVVEGIESKKQYDFVKSIGAQYGQGFYISKPRTAETSLLDNSICLT